MLSCLVIGVVHCHLFQVWLVSSLVCRVQTVGDHPLTVMMGESHSHILRSCVWIYTGQIESVLNPFPCVITIVDARMSWKTSKVQHWSYPMNSVDSWLVAAWTVRHSSAQCACTLSWLVLCLDSFAVIDPKNRLPLWYWLNPFGQIYWFFKHVNWCQQRLQTCWRYHLIPVRLEQ